MAGFGGDEIEIPVKLVTEVAKKAAEEFEKSLVDAFVAGAKAAKNTDDATAKVGQTAQKTGKQGKQAGQEIADGFKQATKSATETNSKLELLEKGFRGLSTAVGSVVKFIERGAAFDDLAGTFDNLATKAGTTGAALEQRLNTALESTIAKSELFRISSESMFAGLDPSQLQVAAEAARSFGDQLGGSTLQNFEKFTDSLIKGNTVAFKRLGIIVDVKEAERQYFEQMGASAAQADKLRKTLTADEKADIARAASVDALNKKLAETEKPALDAADRLDQMRKKGKDAFDEVARGIVTNAEFQRGLGELAGTIEQLDLSSLGKAFGFIAEEAAKALAVINKFFDDYRVKLNSALQQTAAAKPINDKLLGVTDLLNKGAAGDKEATIEAGRQIRDIVNKTTGFAAQADLSGQFAAGAFAGDIEKLRAQQEALAKSQGVYGLAALKAADAQQDLNKAVNEGVKPVEKQTNAVETQTKKTKTGAKTLEEYQKRLADLGKAGKTTKDELEKLNDKLALKFDQAIPPELARKVDEIFQRDAGLGQSKLLKDLQAIGATLGKDTEAMKGFLKAVDEAKKKELNVLGPGNDAGEAQFKVESASLADIAKNKGSIFGIDAGFSKELSQQIEGALQDAFSLVKKALTTGLSSDDAAAIGSTIGTVIGAAIGSYFGPAGTAAGAAIGSAAGGIIGEFAKQFGEDTAGTKARKAADKFFADMFDADRLSVIVGDEVKRINDLVFNPAARKRNLFERGNDVHGDLLNPVPSSTNRGQDVHDERVNGRGDNDPFASGEFDDNLQAQKAEVQSAFQAVGGAFEEMLGIASDIAGQVGAVLFNNIGGSLENLQILIQTSGKSFEELGNAIFDSFFNGTIGLLELQGQLQALQDLYLPGIPGQIGAVDEAARNLQIALADGKGSRILLDSLRDVGAEAMEIGHKDLPFVAQSIAAALGLGANQVTQLLAAMKAAGINSVQELVDASNAKLAALALNIKQVTEGQAPTNAPVTDPTAGYTPPTNFNDGKFNAPSKGKGGGDKGKSEAEREADKRKRELEQLRQQVIKTLQTTDEYQKVIEKLNKGEISQKEATKEIRKEYTDLFDTTQKLKKAQEELEKVLSNPKAKSKKSVAELAAEVDRLQEKLDKLSGKAKDETVFDLSGVTKVIATLDQLGAVANAVGVTLEKNTKILVEGFLKGRLSISEFRSELEKSEEILSQGIPNAVGAVGEAVSNLQGAGRQGGLFSVDSLQDIGAELDELIESRGGEGRAAKLVELTKSVDAANAALQSGIQAGKTPAELQALREQVEQSKLALDSFRETTNKPTFGDLRDELRKTLPEDQVDIFFKALEDNGIDAFEELVNASDETAAKVLASLDEYGFAFANEVTPSIKASIDAFNAAEVAAQGGKDVLGVEVQLVKDFNSAVQQLPASFGETIPAIQGIQEPLGQLSAGFDDLLEKLAQLTLPQKGSITYDVSFNAADGKSQKLFDLLFGDGSTTIGGTGGSGPGAGGGLTQQQQRRYKRLTAKRKNGRLSASERAEFEELRRQANGAA